MMDDIGLSDQELAMLERIYEQQGAEAAERLRFSVGFAQSGLQALTLVNGGALVALFTFVGSTSAAISFDLSAMWSAFAFFAAGLVMNILAYLGGHVSQDRFYVMSQYMAWNAEYQLRGRSERNDPMPSYRLGSVARIVGIVTAMLALACFIAGAGFALSGVLPR